MSRAREPPKQLSDELKVPIVLAVQAGEVTQSEAARRDEVTQPTVSSWKRPSAEAGGAAERRLVCAVERAAQH